jgi:hypothetical protein
MDFPGLVEQVQQQVLGAGQHLVDGRILAGQPDQLTHPVGVPDDVVPTYGGMSSIGLEQGAEDSDSGGLARTVRPQQAQDGAGPHAEIDPIQGRRLTEPLDQALGPDRVIHRFHSCSFDLHCSMPVGSDIPTS